MHAAAGKPLIIKDGLDLAITASLYAHPTNEGAGAFTLIAVSYPRSPSMGRQVLHSGALSTPSRILGPSDVASGWIRWQQQCGVC